jgi:hypothetical protein
MTTFEEDFKDAIEQLCKEHNYHADYITIDTDLKILIRVHIRGGKCGYKVEVVLTGRDCTVIIPESDIKKSFRKDDLNDITNCIKNFLETHLAIQ